MERVRVVIESMDAITQAGLVSYVQAHDMAVATEAQRSRADVVVLATPRLDGRATAALRQAASTLGVPVVLLVNEMDESALLPAVECNVTAVLPRSAAADDRLADQLRDAACGVRAPDLLGRLIEHVQRLQGELRHASVPRSASLSGRETDVLRLMAEGWSTDEIARKLCYSERTVKNVISTITSQLRVRNRPHAVAYALRAGMI